MPPVVCASGTPFREPLPAGASTATDAALLLAIGASTATERPAHMGRYLQPDPWGVETSPNLYAYVENNPLTYIDPLGLSTVYISPPRIKTPMSDDEFRRTCPAGSYACTIFRGASLICPCQCKDGGWSMTATAYVTPYMYLPKPRFETHEALHVEDIRGRVKGYLDGLEAIKFPSEVDCNNSCQQEQLSFVDRMLGYSYESNRALH